MKWTKAEITKFDDLVEEVSSRDQVTRVSGRFAMGKFIDAHGKDKCDAMFKHLEAKGAKADFDDGAKEEKP